MSRISCLFALLAAVALAAAPGVSAADCVDTVGLTPLERDFHSRASAALQALLPGPVQAEGIKTIEVTPPDPGSLNWCPEDKKPGGFSIQVRRQFLWPDPNGRQADVFMTVVASINLETLQLKSGTPGEAFGAPSPKLSEGLTVRNVLWMIDDSGLGVDALRLSLRASLTAAIDRSRFEALVGRPLPSVAASQALTNNVRPTALVAAPVVTPATAPAVTPPAAPAAAPADHAAAPPATDSGNAPGTSAGDKARGALDGARKLRGILRR